MYFLAYEYSVAHLDIVCLHYCLYFLHLFILYGIASYPPFLQKDVKITFSFYVYVIIHKVHVWDCFIFLSKIIDIFPETCVCVCVWA